MKTGRVVTDSSWDALLIPTPNHQDYLSTHATFGAAAGAVIRAWNKGDKVDVYLSSNVTLDNVGVITRRITSIKQAVIDNGDSRVFGGVSFPNSRCGSVNRPIFEQPSNYLSELRIRKDNFALDANAAIRFISNTPPMKETVLAIGLDGRL